MILHPQTKVVHCENDVYDIYIGRPSIWGNPFTEDNGDTRTEVIQKYREWLLNSPNAEDVRSNLHILEGKILGCWCKPKACHGDVLAEIVNNGILDLLV